MESQVLKDELLMGAESAEQPAEQMSERHDHVKNLTETSRFQLCAKSLIPQVYEVLARHNVDHGSPFYELQQRTREIRRLKVSRLLGIPTSST